MRVSTLAYFDTALASIEQQTSNVTRLTREVGTGQEVNVPSDNPPGFSLAQRVQANMAGLKQMSSDNARLSDQLGLGSQTVSQALTLIDRVRSIALQAANGTTNAANRAALAEQVTTAKAQLLALVNTRAGNGTYLFAGSRGSVEPFAQLPSGQVVYRGDGASQSLHTAPDESVSSLLSGQPFASVMQGNGYASASASGANTGSAVAVLTGVTSLASAAAFRDSSAPYTISFATSATGLTYTVTQSGSTVTTGSFASGMSLTLSGLSIRMDGTPNAGDQFQVSPSRPQSLFDTLDQMITALSAPTSTPSENAQNVQAMDSVLSNLTQGETRLVSLQATLGVAMRAINASNNTDATQLNSDSQVMSSALDANIPKVLTALNEQHTALAAAMSAFGTMSKLSLFNYV